ncbi:MAG: hypothetical protein HOY78_40890 [Saccharothrix sp.]|nr:hypothetical protein [Saccharothrix sp.]
MPGLRGPPRPRRGLPVPHPTRPQPDGVTLTARRTHRHADVGGAQGRAVVDHVATGDRDTVVVETAFGLGEVVVSGSVTPNTCTPAPGRRRRVPRGHPDRPQDPSDRARRGRARTALATPPCGWRNCANCSAATSHSGFTSSRSPRSAARSR